MIGCHSSVHRGAMVRDGVGIWIDWESTSAVVHSFLGALQSRWCIVVGWAMRRN